MDDDRLTGLLRDLPRATAGPDFNAKVLARIRERTAPPVRSLRWAVAAAACAVAVLTLGAWRMEEQRAARERDRALLAELRAEQRALAAELARYSEFDAPPPGQVYVGGNEQVDFVLDVARPVRTPIQTRP